MALFILLVSMLGLLQATSYIGQENIKNQMRDEAVQIAEESMATFRAVPFALVSTNYPAATPHAYAPLYVPSALRGVSKNYTVLRSATFLSSSNNSISMDVRVLWNYKNWSTEHEVVTLRSN